MTEAREMQAHVEELTGHEFLMLVEELSSLIRAKGFGPITVLCDEANHLPDA